MIHGSGAGVWCVVCSVWCVVCACRRRRGGWSWELGVGSFILLKQNELGFKS